MGKFVVYVDSALMDGNALVTQAASAGVEAAATAVNLLSARRTALQEIAAALTQPALIPHGVMLRKQDFDIAAAGGGVSADTQILEGVGAIVFDEDDVDPLAFEGISGITVVENITLSLPTPVISSETASSNWHLDKIGARATGADGAGVLVGILDTGIDAGHLEFGGHAIPFAEFSASGNLISNVPRDAGDHGTHVAGLIAGATCGVAPAARLAVAAVLTGPRGSGTLIQILNGMNWLITQPFRENQIGVDVVNASFGATGYHPFLENPVRSARTLGILTIAAVGNDGLNVGFHGSPGNYSNVLSVGATDASDRVAGFSSWGDGPDPRVPPYVVPQLSAPGVGVRSAMPNNGFQTMSGTSMATPIVAGVAAQRLQTNPALRGNPTALTANLCQKVVSVVTGPNGNLGGVGRVVA